MADATYKIEVDWDGDLSWDNANTDITSRVMELSYGRGKNEELGKAAVGRATIKVSNTDGLFSPTLGAGALYGDLEPYRRVKITETSIEGYGVEFDGASGDIKVTDAASIQNIWDGGGTVSTWVYVDSDGEANVGRIFDKTAWYLNVNSEAASKVKVTLWVDFDGVANGQWTTTATEITLASWTKIDVMYDSDATANNPTIAINDVDKTVGAGLTEDTTPVGTRVTDVGSDLYIGNNSADSNTFDGKFDSAEWYNRTAGGAERATNYNSGTGLSEPSDKTGLVLWFPLNEDVLTTVYDWSPYKNNGTITGGTWTDGKVPLDKRLFTGYIEHITPNPHPTAQSAQIFCVDGLDFLARAETQTAIYNDETTGYLANRVLVPTEWDGVPLDGLVGWWSFDPWSIDGTTVYDLSERGNDGVMTGYVEGGVEQGYCQSRSMQFDESTSQVIVPASASLDITKAVSVVSRVMWTGTQNFPRIARKGGEEYALWKEGTRYRFQIEQGGGVGANAQTALATVVSDKWQNVAGTFDGTDIKVYLEADLKATTNSPGDIDSAPATEFQLGNSPVWGGFIEFVALYNRALTPTEITLFKNLKCRREIDTGQDSPPFGYFDSMQARNALGQLEDSELSFVKVDGLGRLCYEDRHHRYTPEHQTSRWTINDTMNEIVYDYGVKILFNEVEAGVTPWTSNAIATLWEMSGETPGIPAGGSITIWGPFNVSDQTVWGNAVTEPVATTDYTANAEAGGAGADMTGDLSFVNTVFSQTIKMVITNGGAVKAYLTALKVRGTYYSQDSTIVRKSTDEDSIRAYQKRTLTLGGKFMSDSDQAQNACDYGIAKYKDPQALPQIVIKGNKAAATLKQVIVREISDRVTVVNTDLGLNSDFFINAMQHTISQRGLLHTVRYTLADATNDDFWILDYSVLDTSTKLGY